MGCNKGASWTTSDITGALCPQANGEWSWSIADRDSGRRLLSGVGKSRAVAAAHIVRAIAVGMTASDQETLAA